jgi:hypothetical protein
MNAVMDALEAHTTMSKPAIDVNRLPNLTPYCSAPLELDSFMRRF